MDREFCRERANTVRAIAELADPLVRKRLLELAEHYDRRAAIRSVSAENEHHPPRPRG